MRIWRAIGLVGILAAQGMWAQGAIRLKTGTIDPARVARRTSMGRHFIVQFRFWPDAETRQELARRGMRVLQYVPDNALMVSAAGAADLEGLEVTWSGTLDAADKISPAFDRDGTGAYLVVFHADVDVDQARALASGSGLDVVENSQLLPGHLLVTGAYRRLAALAAHDEVSYVMPASFDLLARRRVYVCPGPITDAGPVGDYVLVGSGWPKDSGGNVALRYFFRSVTERVEQNTAQGEIERAFQEWARYANFSLTGGQQASATRSVDILFARGTHGDAYPFDGPGGVLAHTFYPAPPNAEPVAGDMHFDADENWHVGSTVDLFSVALHEAGHALGLGHSDNPQAVMYPYYRQQTGLTNDDIAGIRALYGSSASSGTPPAQPPVQPPTQPPAQPPTQPPTSGGTPADTTAPSLRILSPGGSIVSTSSASLAVSGVAGDNVGVASVKWTTSLGYSGTATGTANWSAVVPLLVGNNVVTVRAYDAAGNSAWRAITVVRR